jgi:hypothetical protein
MQYSFWFSIKWLRISGTWLRTPTKSSHKLQEALYYIYATIERQKEELSAWTKIWTFHIGGYWDQLLLPGCLSWQWTHTLCPATSSHKIISTSPFGKCFGGVQVSIAHSLQMESCMKHVVSVLTIYVKQDFMPRS